MRSKNREIPPQKNKSDQVCREQPAGHHRERQKGTGKISRNKMNKTDPKIARANKYRPAEGRFFIDVY
jgi:hypothetical protein